MVVKVKATWTIDQLNCEWNEFERVPISTFWRGKQSTFPQQHSQLTQQPHLFI